MQFAWLAFFWSVQDVRQEEFDGKPNVIAAMMEKIAKQRNNLRQIFAVFGIIPCNACSFKWIMPFKNM